MKKTKITQSVHQAAELLSLSIQQKGFTLFADIDHQANAQSVELQMSPSRVLIFGNPVAGTKLMQADIAISLDLPLRLAIVEDAGQTLIIHQSTEDYSHFYQVENHPVLSKVEELFSQLVAELT